MQVTHPCSNQMVSCPSMPWSDPTGSCLESGDVQSTGVSLNRQMSGGPRGTLAKGNARAPAVPAPLSRPPAALQHHGPGADKPTLCFPQVQHRPRHNPKATPHPTAANAAKTPWCAERCLQPSPETVVVGAE